MRPMSRALEDSLRSVSAAPARDQRGQATLRRVSGRAAGLIGLNQSTSLARRFLVASLLVLLVGGLVIGWWIGNQLERGIIDRTASITGLYVESFVQPRIESLAQNEWLTDDDKKQLDWLLADTPFGERVVSLKVWRPDGTVVYSQDAQLIGQQFPVDGELAEAVGGTVGAHMSSLDDVENVSETARGYSRLLEMYVPVREPGSERVIGVAEFYQLPTEIDQEVFQAQLSSWLVVTIAVALVYLLLYGIVRQGSDTIQAQQLALQSQVTELSALLDQNEQLRERVRVAAERNTTLSERQLRRISSDLHDGPGQMLALAMLRLDEVVSSEDEETRTAAADDVKTALDDALRDMRAIAAGLRLPELQSLSTTDVLRRAVDDHSRRTGGPVALEISALQREAQLPTKIALFRAAQELLSNATRHGKGRDVAVRLYGDDDQLFLSVSDGGPGMAGGVGVGAEGHLGLAGIREQAELLGGGFDIGSGPGGGTRVTVSWPL
jgi:signal transduction histidine kinase